MAETDSAVVGGSSSSITDNKTPPDDEPPTSTQFVDETASPSSTSPNHLGLSCEMCRNYEINLTNLQDEERKTREELKAVVALSNRYESELSAERQYRKELEEKMSAKCRETEEQIAAATEDFEKLKERIVKLGEQQDEERKVSLQKLADLAKANEDLEKEFSVMTAKYTKLLGTNRARASEMRAAAIELPTDVDQLQFACLQLREELIESRSAKEHVENELRGEIALLRETREAEKANAEAMERSLVAQVNELNASLGIANSQLSALGESSTRMEENSRTISDLKATVAELEAQIQQVQGERQALEQTCANYRNRCMTLQQELDTTEGVQKDFVKLSQNLQIQLEKIRQSSTEVRWQFDEDVDQCPECRVSLVRVRPRPHCLHCGKIFCAPCLRQTIPSGPHRRPAPVCQVCHTLLNRESAPFFSQQ